MYGLPGHFATGDLREAKPGSLARLPEHLALDVNAVEATTWPTETHCDGTLHVARTTARSPLAGLA